MKKIVPAFIIFVIPALFFGQAWAGFGDPGVSPKAFESGEKLRFVGSYFMSSLWTDVVDITMEVQKVENQKRPVLRLDWVARTYAAWDRHFKIRDFFQSWIDEETGKPLLFKRDVEEGAYKNKSDYIFKRNSLKVDYTGRRKKDPERKGEVTITPETHDPVSLLYHIRNVDLAAFPIGKEILLAVFFNEKLNLVQIKYHGQETLSVEKLGKKSCHKFSVAWNIKKTDKKEKNFIWLTADQNRVPVLIKAFIRVGSVQIRLVQMEGLGS